jgi:hypothetical protein
VIVETTPQTDTTANPADGGGTCFQGHTSNVRALALDPTGKLCLSGGSDSTFRLWDLGQQRCVQTYSVHSDSVWALLPDASFSRVYSGASPCPHAACVRAGLVAGPPFRSLNAPSKPTLCARVVRDTAALLYSP